MFRGRRFPYFQATLCALFQVACGTGEGDANATAGETSGTSTTSPATMSGSGSSTTVADTMVTTEAPTGEPTTTAEPTTEEPTTGDPTQMSSSEAFLPPQGDQPFDECTTWEENCPEGEKCMPYANDGGSSWNALKCVDITGTGVEGEPCTVSENRVSGLDDCAQGFMCWDVDPDSFMGKCVAFCEGSPEEPTCASEMSQCALTGNGILALCLSSCDVLLQDCKEGFGCYVANNQAQCVLVAAPDDGGLAGDDCEFLNECQLGLQCIDANFWPGCEMQGCCAPFCDLSDPDCPDATQCTALFEEPEPWQQDYGICGVP